MQLPPEVSALYPFESRWADIGGHRIHYLDEGRGRGKPTVLLLHGNPTWSFVYREIIPKLTERCRVIAPDYLGMGLSDKPLDERLYTLENHTRILTELIGKLGLRDVILCLQDWGGPIGLGYAIEHSHNVAGALLMNTWAWPEPSPFHAATMPWRLMHAPVAGPFLLLRCNALIERGLYLSTGRRDRLKRGPILQGYRVPYTLPLSRIAILAFPRNIPLKPGDLNWDRMAAIERGLADIKFPCRLLWGEKDIVFPPENALRLQKLIPGCPPPRGIPHGMHFIQEDAPDEIAEELLALAAECPGEDEEPTWQ